MGSASHPSTSLAVGVGGDAGFVGDEDDGGPFLARRTSHQAHHELAGE